MKKFAFGWLTVCVLAVWICVRCTNPVQTGLQVRVSFANDRSGAGTGVQTSDGGPSGSSGQFSFPSSADGMDCYLVNIRGQGVPPRYFNGLPGITSPACLGLAAVSDTVALSSTRSQSVTLMVPPGPQRTVQVLGITGFPNCSGSDLGKLLGSGAPVMTLVGQTTLDISQNTTVTVTSTYDPSTASDLFPPCLGNSLPPFIAAADNQVSAITIPGDGTLDVIVGGQFTHVNGTQVPYIARLRPDGTLAPGFSASFNNPVLGMATGPGGNLFAVGPFTTSGGLSRNGIAKFSANGPVDPSFLPAGGFSANAQAIVLAGPKLYVGGAFTSYQAVSSPYLIALDSQTASIAQTYSLLNPVNALDISPDGSELYAAQGGAPGISKLQNGSLDTSFSSAIGSGANATAYTVRLAPDDPNKFYLGGAFTSFNGTSVGCIARITHTGGLDTSFNTMGTGFNGSVLSMSGVYDGTGDIIVAGTFNSYNGQLVSNIVRLSTTGALVSAFVGGPISGGTATIYAPVPRSFFGNSLYIGGLFTDYGPTATSNLIRINAQGGLN